MSEVRPLVLSPAEHAKEQKRILWLSILLFIAFLAVILASCLVAFRVVDEQAADRSELIARTAAAKDVELRDWMATFGGIYVPITDATPPNPYLNPVGREISGPDGQPLTKMNPAYVTRLLHERWGDKYGMIGHITSLKPLRPQNAAAPWEVAALEKLIQQGSDECYIIREENGVRTLQHMTPLRAKPGCLKCHTTQGYQVGDIMGGISNTVPLALVTGTDAEVRRALIMGYGIVSLFMLAFFVWGAKILLRRNAQRHAAEQALQDMALTLEERIKERTGELQLAKESADLILSSTLEGIIEVDTEGDILFINKAGQELSGYGVGDSMRDAFAGTLANNTHAQGCSCPRCVAAYATTRQRFADVSMQCKGNDFIFIEGSTSPVVKNGQRTGNIFVFHNILEYSKLEYLQQAIFASSVEPFLLFSPKKLTLCNNAAMNFFGVAADEELYSNFLNFSEEMQKGIPTEVCFNQYFEECDKNSKASFNWVHRHKDGTPLPCRVTMSKIEHPLYSGFLASLMDLRAILHYEEQLQQDRDLLNGIIHASPMPMYIEDQDGVVNVINPAAEALLPLALGGAGSDAWMDKTLLHDLREQVRSGKPIATCPAKLQSRTSEEHLETRTSLSLVTYEDKEACLVWVQDISDLVFAKEQAESFSRAKSDFLARMSHEIRTPMNAILGMTYLFLQNHMEDWQRRYILKIQDASKGLLGIINDILDFSRIEAGKMELEVSPFSLSELVENVGNVCSPMAEDKKLELLFHIDPNMHGAVFEGDLLRLSQVLINLVCNALKFTAKGEVVLRIEELQRTSSNASLSFSVRDSGIGMTEEQMNRLFQPFEQADISTTRRFGGTGLGLVICNELVQMMGGTVSVSSVVDQGTTFTFQITLRSKDNGKSRKYAIIAQNERVLVVDDNDTARDLLRDMITCFGFRVDVVASGEAACGNILWASSTNSPYSIVILDWKMPGMDGFECARLIKDLPISTPPKLLMISAYGLDEYMNKGNSVGLVDYIAKPVTPSALFNALARIMGVEGLAPSTKNTQVQLEMSLGTIQGARILLVEDNETNQEVASKLLTRVGMVVEIASNGLEAVNLCKTRTYDLVFMDIQMPVMDGLEAVHRIRADESSDQRMPIVAMTAHAMKSDRDKSLEAGMNDHITKPIDPTMLQTTLLKWILPRTAEVVEPLFTPKVAETPSLPFSVPGVDVARGLHNVGGDVESLTHHLRRFTERYSNYAANLETEMLAGRWEDAGRIAHTLKGVGATLGMNQLAECAAKMEKLCGTEALTTFQILHLETMIAEMCVNIQASLDQPEEFAQKETSTSGKKDLCRLLHLLPDLLARDIGRCMATLTEIKGFVPALLSAERYKAIYDAVYEFDSVAVAQVATEVEAELE